MYLEDVLVIPQVLYEVIKMIPQSVGFRLRNFQVRYNVGYSVEQS